MSGDGAMTVSVIMAVRNGGRFLGEALASLRAQTRPAHEILLVDGASTDDTLDIAAAHGGVTVLSQQGPNLSSAYNEGIAAASGEALAFLSHDDRWAPDKLEAQGDVLVADPAVDWVAGHARYFLHEGLELPTGIRAHLLDGPVAAPMLLEALLVRTARARSIEPFREDLPVAADLRWTDDLRLRGRGGVVLDQVVVDKRVHDRNTAATLDDGQILTAIRGSIEARRRT